MTQSGIIRNRFLSKSSFLKGLQCSKALYLQKYYPNLQDKSTDNQQIIFDKGAEVGVLAHSID